MNIEQSASSGVRSGGAAKRPDAGSSAAGVGRLPAVARWFGHLAVPRWARMRPFPRAVLDAVEKAIRASESRHRGEIVFAVEPALDAGELWRGRTAAERAVQVFADLRVWDTEENNGVLIYLLMADRDVEIVADRGVHGRVGAQGWEAVCRRMEAAFRAGRFEDGVTEGVRAVADVLAGEYPATGGRNPNELSDRPVVLG
jgi:uncharacterized membrane protein